MYKKVFDIEDALKALSDGRKKSTYTTAESVLPVFLGYILRMQSFNELNYKLKSNDFRSFISRKMQ